MICIMKWSKTIWVGTGGRTLSASFLGRSVSTANTPGLRIRKKNEFEIPTRLRYNLFYFDGEKKGISNIFHHHNENETKHEKIHGMRIAFQGNMY
jgi:hypothetical protein